MIYYTRTLKRGVIALFALAMLCVVNTGLADGDKAGSKKSGADVAKKMVLVKDGVSLAPIVVFKNAPPYTRGAADELAEYIEKISGAKPEVIEGLPDPLPEQAIWVGYQPVLKKLFPKIDFDFKHPEEILIAAQGNNLVIVGRDRWDPDHMEVKGHRKKIVGMQLEYGTANAVYSFLQDYLNVRWLWPGKLGEDIIEQKTIAFAPFQYRYHPPIIGRSTVIRLSALGEWERSGDWTRHQRLQLDSLNLPGGHAFTKWWDTFHKTHPEYFALQPDGARDLGWNSPRTAKLCQSNPDIWDQWLADVEEQLKKNPNQTVFNGSPNDSYNSGICVCDNCRALDPPEADTCMYAWIGLSQDYTVMSDRYVTFGNHLVDKLKKRFPDKDYYVLMHAYGSVSLPAPVKAVPSENLIISYVPHFPWSEKDRKELKDGWRKWAERGTKKIIYRPNAGNHVGRANGLPEVLMKKTLEDFKFITKHGCIGIFIDTVWEHWATQGPQLYIMGLLAWNPHLDGQAVLNDYYQRGFGPAAADIKAYWELFEDARTEFVENDGKDFFKNFYTEDLLNKADKWLKRAAEKAAGNPKYSERVAFVRSGFEYTCLMTENYALMDKWRDSGGEDTVSADKVKGNWKQIDTIFKKYPLAFLAIYLQPGGRSMKGLHPDYPRGAKDIKPEKAKKAVKVIPAEKAGWTLAFSDDFKRNDLGKDWQVIDGKWVVKDGCLQGAGTLISSRGFSAGDKPGFQRLEFEVVADSKPLLLIKNKPTPKIHISDMSSFTHAQAPGEKKNSMFTGYFFQFGGFNNTKNRLIKKGRNCVLNSNPDILITPGKVHKIVVENDRGHLKQFVDGELVQEYNEKEPSLTDAGQDRIGFYFWTACKIFNVKVYVK
ncbi:DUF4838 domain-containing protein [Verrucomicrobiota bacterium]